MRVLATLLPFLAQNSAQENEESGKETNEDCIMMIDVVSGEKLCVNNPKMDIAGFLRGKRKQAKAGFKIHVAKLRDNISATLPLHHFSGGFGTLGKGQGK